MLKWLLNTDHMLPLLWEKHLCLFPSGGRGHTSSLNVIPLAIPLDSWSLI